MTPSNRASTLRLFYAEEGKDVEISNKDSIEKEAGSIIEGLRKCYLLYNVCVNVVKQPVGGLCGSWLRKNAEKEWV